MGFELFDVLVAAGAQEEICRWCLLLQKDLGCTNLYMRLFAILEHRHGFPAAPLLLQEAARVSGRIRIRQRVPPERKGRSNAAAGPTGSVASRRSDPRGAS